MPPLALNAFFAQFFHMNTVSFPLYLWLLFLLPVAVMCASVRLSWSVYTRTSFWFCISALNPFVFLSLYCFSSYASPIIIICLLSFCSFLPCTEKSYSMSAGFILRQGEGGDKLNPKVISLLSSFYICCSSHHTNSHPFYNPD